MYKTEILKFELMFTRIIIHDSDRQTKQIIFNVNDNAIVYLT